MNINLYSNRNNIETAQAQYSSCYRFNRQTKQHKNMVTKVILSMINDPVRVGVFNVYCIALYNRIIHYLVLNCFLLVLFMFREIHIHILNDKCKPEIGKPFQK